MANVNLEQTLGPVGSTLYYALWRTSPDLRSSCLALFGLYYELRKLVFSSSETVYVKAGWWYEELERMLSGVPRHPFTIEIANWKNCDELQPLVWMEALEPYFDTRTIENEEHATALSQNLALPLFRGIAKVCNHPDPNQEILEKSATAFVLFSFVQDLGQYLRDGIVPIPETDLKRGSLSPQQIRNSQTTEFQFVMGEQSARIFSLTNDRLSATSSRAHRLPLQLEIITAINNAVLLQIERSKFDLVNTRIDVTPLHKAWITWKTTRRYSN